MSDTVMPFSVIREMQSSCQISIQVPYVLELSAGRVGGTTVAWKELAGYIDVDICSLPVADATLVCKVADGRSYYHTDTGYWRTVLNVTNGAPLRKTDIRTALKEKCDFNSEALNTLKAFNGHGGVKLKPNGLKMSHAKIKSHEQQALRDAFSTALQDVAILDGIMVEKCSAPVISITVNRLKGTHLARSVIQVGSASEFKDNRGRSTYMPLQRQEDALMFARCLASEYQGVVTQQDDLLGLVITSPELLPAECPVRVAS
ncbi:hypothetical protein [Neptuniibacter sp. QD37_11]|uniref:hypothetical protein n=1 Tax=Neptuniibacter sp. QD37_11 TaxID=3398209 RepID=UPI0039F50FE6